MDYFNFVLGILGYILIGAIGSYIAMCVDRYFQIKTKKKGSPWKE